MERLAQRGAGGVNGGARATTWPDASATLAVRALACMGTSWACLGVTFSGASDAQNDRGWCPFDSGECVECE